MRRSIWRRENMRAIGNLSRVVVEEIVTTSDRDALLDLVILDLEHVAALQIGRDELERHVEVAHHPALIVVVAAANEPKHVDFAATAHHRSVPAHLHRVGKARELAESAVGRATIELLAKTQLVP